LAKNNIKAFFLKIVIRKSINIDETSSWDIFKIDLIWNVKLLPSKVRDNEKVLTQISTARSIPTY
jgi:hypothetical protein